MGKSNRSTKPQATLPLGTGSLTCKLRISPKMLRGTAVAVGVGVGVGVVEGVGVLVAVGIGVCVGVVEGIAVAAGVFAAIGVASLSELVQATSSKKRKMVKPTMLCLIAICLIR
jgi:hypothetical protein